MIRTIDRDALRGGFMRTLALQLKRFGLPFRVSQWAFDAYMSGDDMMCDQLSAQLVHSVYGQEASKSFSYQHPATWREALKARFFPLWALKRWPVVMHKVEWEVTAYALFPDIEVDGRRTTMVLRACERPSDWYREDGE